MWLHDGMDMAYHMSSQAYWSLSVPDWTHYYGDHWKVSQSEHLLATSDPDEARWDTFPRLPLQNLPSHIDFLYTFQAFLLFHHLKLYWNILHKDIFNCQFSNIKSIKFFFILIIFFLNIKPSINYIKPHQLISVMVSMPALSVRDHGFKTRSVQTKDQPRGNPGV